MFKRVNKVQRWYKNFSCRVREIKWFLIGVILSGIIGCENGRPVAAGPILTSSNIPLIDTVYESGGSVLVTNSGNADATIISVAADPGVSNLLGCSDMTLAPSESCTISFNVTESDGYATLAVAYSGINGTNALYTLISWYNSRGFALASMSASNNPVSFEAGQTASSTITITNIGGYTLYNLSVPTPVILSGNATAVISANTCAESLPINASCSYSVDVTDNTPEQNQQINLGFSAKYAGPNGETKYNRWLLLTYTANPI